MTFFEKIVLGHLIGDYLVQNRWMAFGKHRRYIPCLVHCLIYTVVMGWVTTGDPVWMAIVFASHFIVDKYVVAEWWLKLISGRNMSQFIRRGHDESPPSFNQNERLNYRMLQGGFNSLVYTIVDNTLHMVLMSVGAWYLGLL